MSIALFLALALMITLVVFPPQMVRVPRAVLVRNGRPLRQRRF